MPWLGCMKQYKKKTKNKKKNKKIKTASYSKAIQIFTLVPDKWFQMYCSEYFKILEYLV